jgi:hypothetical protein
MDEGVFIIVALVIMLGLIAGLYFMFDLHGQRVLGLASEARGREQNEIVNQQRLARALNELIDEMAVLTDALKSERILRSHGEATAHVAAKKALRAPAPPPRDDRATVPMPPPPEALEPAKEAAEDDATRVLETADVPAPKAPPPQPC